MDMIPVEIIEETDPDKYTELLIAHNVQREKANEMKAREFRILKKIEEKKAAERKQATLKQGDKNPDVENLPPRDSQGSQGKSRDIAAKKVGWSGKTGDAAEKVIAHIDSIKESDPKAAAKLTEILNKSVSAAFNEINPKIQPAPEKPVMKEELPPKTLNSDGFESASNNSVKAEEPASKYNQEETLQQDQDAVTATECVSESVGSCEGPMGQTEGISGSESEPVAAINPGALPEESENSSERIRWNGKDNTVTPEFDKAWKTFIAEIAKARENDWNTVPKEVVEKCVATIQSYLGESRDDMESLRQEVEMM